MTSYTQLKYRLAVAQRKRERLKKRVDNYWDAALVMKWNSWRIMQEIKGVHRK